MQQDKAAQVWATLQNLFEIDCAVDDKVIAGTVVVLINEGGQLVYKSFHYPAELVTNQKTEVSADANG